MLALRRCVKGKCLQQVGGDCRFFFSKYFYIFQENRLFRFGRLLSLHTGNIKEYGCRKPTPNLSAPLENGDRVCVCVGRTREIGRTEKE